jgi:hypothetical protein
MPLARHRRASGEKTRSTAVQSGAVLPLSLPVYGAAACWFIAHLYLFDFMINVHFTHLKKIVKVFVVG